MMITKESLVTFIRKYYLGVNESVKWEVKDNTLTVDFMTPTKDVVGRVKLEGVPLQDCSLAVYDTHKLMRLLSICEGEIKLDVESHGGQPFKMSIKDMNFDLSYSLADPFLIGKVNKVNIPEWHAELNLIEDDILFLLKAKNALPDIDNLIIRSTIDQQDKPACEFVFGDESGHNNKISYSVPGRIDDPNLNLPFNSDHLKMILHSNRKLGGGKMFISNLGLMKIEFGGEGTESEYFMVRKADNH